MTKIESDLKKTLQEEIQADNWKSLRCGYICFANSLIADHAWQGYTGGIPPGGVDGEDILEIVLLKILEGKLSCNVGVEFEAFIIQSIKSEVSNLSKTTE